MSKIGYLLVLLAFCDVIICEENEEAETFDFGPIFESGISSLASNPLAAAVLKVDKSQYPEFFDTIVSSSIDSIHTRAAPRDAFSAESFGFHNIASKSFIPPVKPAKLVTRPRPQPHLATIQEQPNPLQYDIRTVHDANYKIYKPEESDPEPILAALRRNPAVAGYFKPAATNIEVAHPLKYRTEQSKEVENIETDYNPKTYLTGSSRIRRYTGGGRKRKTRRHHDDDEEEDDPYGYKAEYVSQPKAFSGPDYSSPYTQEEKDPNKDYEYPFDYDSGYDHKEYERIKELSEKQAAEIKQNPGNCKEVKKDGMTCAVCKDPKTGGNYESCSYVAEPKNNQYAYSKEKKFNSRDQPDEPENEEQEESPNKSAKYEESKDDDDAPSTTESSDEEPKHYANYKSPEHEEDNSGEKYKGYYVHTSQPKSSEALRSGEVEVIEEKPDEEAKPYDYKAALPEFYTDNEPKKDVEHVLAEFKKKDRSTCKKVNKNGMTCFQCIDKSGLKHEECMFVSESAPKRSHLAYQELKEFTSKPPSLAVTGNEEAESQTITTSAPLPLISAAYVAPNTYGKKLKRKKANRARIAEAASTPVVVPVSFETAPVLVPADPTDLHPTPQSLKARLVKRSEQSEGEDKAAIVDETNIAPPEEFAGDSSKGAFWAETLPRYSAALGVTLPEFMLARSEHEASFDELVAGA